MQKNHTKNSFGLHALPSIAAIAFSCSGGQAWAIGTEDEVFQKPLQAEFNKLDSNQDHKLSRTEISDDANLAGQFQNADDNSDDVLIVEEYAALKSQIQQNRIERYLDDSTVTAKIKAELIQDAGMQGLDISVETHMGQVILSGFVKTPQQSRRAMQIASGVRGVTSVKNSLIVKS